MNRVAIVQASYVPFAHVWTFAGDSVVRFVQFVDTAGWNAALNDN